MAQYLSLSIRGPNTRLETFSENHTFNFSVARLNILQIPIALNSSTGFLTSRTISKRCHRKLLLLPFHHSLKASQTQNHQRNHFCSRVNWEHL